MIVTSSILKYPTKKIKDTINTSIRELTSGELYDYFPTPNINIVNINDSSILYNDSVYNILIHTFASKLLSTSSVKYTYDGNNYHEIFNGKLNDTSSISIDLTDGIKFPVSNTYKIVISSLYDGNKIESSSPIFSISTRSLQIINPEINGVIYGKNNILPIKWTGSGINNAIDIFILDANNTVKIEDGYISTENQYNFKVDSFQFSGDDFNILISSNGITSTSKDYKLVNSIIQSENGYKICNSYIKGPTEDMLNFMIELQGIYDYREYAIEILDDIGEAYYPKPFVSISPTLSTYIPRFKKPIRIDGLDETVDVVEDELLRNPRDDREN